MNYFNINNSLNDRLLNDDDDDDDESCDNIKLQYNEFNDKINETTIKNMYNYYLHQGFSNIFLLEIFNFISSLFLIFILTVIFKCIDYSRLFHYKGDEQYLWDFIYLENIFDNSFFNVSCLIILTFYILLRIIGIIGDLQNYKKIKQLMKNEFNLSTFEISNIEWNTLAEKIKNKYGDEYNIYNLNHIILRKENFLIPIFSSKLNKFIFSKLMEWNLIYCLFDTVYNELYDDHNSNYNSNYILIQSTHFNDNETINHNESINENESINDNNRNYVNNIVKIKNKSVIVNKIIKNILTLSFMTFLFMPFIFIYIFFYTILKYGERYYNNPEKVSYRQWSLSSMWKLRYYNELKHNLNMRMNISSKYAKEYLDFNKSKITVTIVKFITFLASSCFIILLLLSLFNEHILLNLNISEDKHVLWYLGIFGSIIAIGKNMSKDIKKPNKIREDSYKKLTYYNQFITFKSYYNKEYGLNEINLERIKRIKKYYEFQLLTLVKECLSVLIVPFCLIYLCNYIDSFLDKFEKNLYYDDVLGFIAKDSNFKHLNKNSNKKSLISFKEFRNNHDMWGKNIENFQLSKSIMNKSNTNMRMKSILDFPIDSEISIL